MKKQMLKVLLFALMTAMILGLSACKTAGGNEAYELWQGEGNKGSEADFLEWIKEKSEPSVFDPAVFEPKTAVYDGLPHEVLVTGAPEGTKIVYANNVGTAVGVYRAFAYLENNGKTKVLTTVLTIELAEITRYNFEDTSVIYNGGKHMLAVQDLPDGVFAEYFCGGVPFDGAVDAGEYVITAELTGELYKPLTITAKLTVEKAGAGIKFNNKTAEYNLEETHTIAVTGTIPEGVSVTYKDALGNAFESAKTPGEYEITAVISGGKNYKDAELKATLTITKADLSKKISFKNATFKHDGTKKMIYITGALPADANVKYTQWGNVYEGRTATGSDYVTATVYGDYYKELKLEATLYVVGNRLDAPANVEINGTNLIWTKDPKAKSYEVAVYDASEEFLFSTNSETDDLVFEEINKCRIESLLKINSKYPGNYIVRVKAFPNKTNEGNFAESEYSSPVTYTLVNGKLYPPQNVRTDGGLLKWDAVSDAYYYNIAVQFVDGNGNIIKQKEVVGVTGNGRTSMSINTIVERANYGPGNYKFAVFVTPTSQAPNGQLGQDVSRTSDYSEFTDAVTV